MDRFFEVIEILGHSGGAEHLIAKTDDRSEAEKMMADLENMNMDPMNRYSVVEVVL